MKINRFNETISPNDKSAKNVELLFSNTSKNFDKKSKLNKASEVIFDKDFMDKITSDGLTYEDMQNIEAPVLRYSTQMTIHGIFPQFDAYGIGGYKNLILNKNGSLGIKYNAIDYAKKMELSRLIINMKYERNSKENYFFKTTTDLESVKTIYDRIDTSLFIGNKYLNKFNFMGQIYYALTVYIYCFPVENLTKIAENIDGISSDEVAKIKQKEKEESDAKWDKFRKETEEKEAEKKKEFENELLNLEAKFGKPVEITSESGILLGVKMGYSEVEYKLFKYNGKKGAYHSFIEKNTDLEDYKDDIDRIDSSFATKKRSDKNLDALLRILNRNFKFFKI